MNNPTPPKLFAEPPVRPEYIQKRRRRFPRAWIRIGILALLIGTCGGLASYWAFGGEDEQAPAEIPTIKAEGPVKQRPEQPGGIDIPHQNETVFQQIDSSSADKPPAVEHLLPPPEVPAAIAPQTQKEAQKPQELSAVAAAPAGHVEKIEAPAAKQENQQEIKPENAAVLTEAPKESSPASPKEPAGEVAPAPAKITATAGNLPKEMFTGETVAKNSLVQLGSFPDQQTAQSEMKKTQKKYADTLGSAKLRLTKADLGRKGTFYRLQAGPMTDAQARSICATLWSQKAPCMLVRP